MKKISEQLAELTARASKIEKSVAEAKQENQEKLEARLETAKVEIHAKKQALNISVQSMDETASKHWIELKQNFESKINQMKQEVDERKDSFDLKRAKKRADRADKNAEGAVFFALLAIVEAEVAVLEAVDARVYALSLEKNAA